MFDGYPDSKNDFKDVKLNFDKNFEIIKIWDTSIKYQLQIIARNREAHVLVAVVWDFEKDIEISMF